MPREPEDIGIVRVTEAKNVVEHDEGTLIISIRRGAWQFHPILTGSAALAEEDR